MTTPILYLRCPTCGAEGPLELWEHADGEPMPELRTAAQLRSYRLRHRDCDNAQVLLSFDCADAPSPLPLREGAGG